MAPLRSRVAITFLAAAVCGPAVRADAQTTSSPTITALTLFSADSSGAAAGGQIWNTQPFDGIWVLGLAAGTDVNGPLVNNADGTVNLAISGEQALVLFANQSAAAPVFETGGQFFGLNIFFDGSPTPGISALGQLGTSTLQPNSSTNTVGMSGFGIVAGAGSLTFASATGPAVTLTQLTIPGIVPSVNRVGQGETLMGLDEPDGILTIVLSAQAPPPPDPEPPTLYDNFDEGARIDPEKWVGRGGGTPVLDARRAQAGGKLRLLNRSYGTTDANTGSRTGQVSAGFTDPAAVTAIQTTLEVEALEARGCTSNGEPGRVSAQIFGTFFNTGIPIPNSSLNDVAVALDITRSTDSSDPRDVLQINAGVLLCTTDNCSQVTVISSANLGTVLRKEPVTLKVQWDPRNSQFIVQRDQLGDVLLPYAVPDSSPAGNPTKILAVNSTVPNCTAARRPTGMIRVSFDDVFVNRSAAR